MILLLGGLLLAAGLSACSGFGKWPEQDSSDYQTFARLCSGCHNLPHPGRHTPEQWDSMLALMKNIMDQRKMPYTTDELKVIRAYLHRNAR